MIQGTKPAFVYSGVAAFAFALRSKRRLAEGVGFIQSCALALELELRL